jgi:alanine-synthesizing transaminase
VIDLGMGNPNDPPPQRIIDKLVEAVEEPRNHRYSVAADGIPSLKREVARSYRRHHGVEVDPEGEVVCTIGSKEGISHLALVLVDGGDSAVVPTPAFPIHLHSVTIAGGEVLTLPLGTDETFLAGLDALIRSASPKPKLLILNFPHNPTGQTVELDFLRRVVDLARAHDVFIIHDFAYSQITFDGYRAPSLLEVPGAKEIAVEFSTMSKSFNMAGWRVGFCVGNAEAVAGLAQIKGYYDYGMFMPVQIASIIALRDCMDEVRAQAATYQARRDALCDALGRIGWPVERPRGAMFVWAPLPAPLREMGSVEFSLMLLERANVAVAPGAAFGEGGDGFVRMALVENRQRLQQAARQIGRALRLTAANT